VEAKLISPPSYVFNIRTKHEYEVSKTQTLVEDTGKSEKKQGVIRKKRKELSERATGVVA